jgi:hypothetical protein
VALSTTGSTHDSMPCGSIQGALCTWGVHTVRNMTETAKWLCCEVQAGLLAALKKSMFCIDKGQRK